MPTDSESSTATLPAPSAAPPQRRPLPRWRVLLLNDRINHMDRVVEIVARVVRLAVPVATRCMLEAHRKGVSLLVVTHREHAELLVEQLRSERLRAAAEPEEG
jgi:ATP-dependent Clp protease adapter protein ClpS